MLPLARRSSNSAVSHAPNTVWAGSNAASSVVDIDIANSPSGNKGVSAPTLRNRDSAEALSIAPANGGACDSGHKPSYRRRHDLGQQRSIARRASSGGGNPLRL